MYEELIRRLTVGWTVVDLKTERMLMLPTTKEFCLGDKENMMDFIGLLMVQGAMCPKCGYGTRKTSKNWRRCKRPECGERIHMVPATKENAAAANAAIKAAKAECADL